MLELEISVDASDLPKLTEGQISKLVRSVASRVRKSMIDATPIGDRPLMGRKRTKNSWTGVTKDAGGWSFSNPLVQAKFLEEGSKVGARPWPSVPKKNPRTVYSNDGSRLFSSQAPEGMSTKAKVDDVANKVAVDLFKLLIQGKSLDRSK